MKVAFMLGSLTMGGTETLLLDVFRNASVSDFEFLGIHRKGGILESSFYKVSKNFYKISPKCKFDINYLYKLRIFLLQQKVDIVHAQLCIDALYAKIACIGTKIKVVQTIHSFDNLNPNKKDKLFILTSKLVNLNIFVSNYLKKYYEGKYRLNPNKTSTIYNGISFDKLNIYGNKAILPRKDNGLQLVMVGSFLPGRSQLFICKALNEIKKNGVIFDFYFVGKYTEKHINRYQECYEYCEQNNLIENVHFLGQRDDISDILRTVDAFVYATEHDTFGLAVVEAIAMGVPTFVNDWYVMKEISENGKYALLYKSDNVNDLTRMIVQFSKDTVNFKDKALKNIQIIRKKYSIKSHIANLNDIYQKILNS